MNNDNKQRYDEKELNPMSGWYGLLIQLVILGIGIAMAVIAASYPDNLAIVIPLCILAVLFIMAFFILSSGFKQIAPNEALVLLFFGKYYGTIKKEGFFFVNPLCVAFNPAVDKKIATGQVTAPNTQNKKMSLKAMTLNNEKQKVNDSEGNPIEIGVVVIWKICDTAKAAFNVENYAEFISTQADATIRNIARQYPYDIAEDGDEKSLRGSSQEIAAMLCTELQDRVDIAGIKIIEARISHLAYSQEIAAAMLQRQQAKAIVDARTTIVEGAVGMVELALEKLNETGIVELDEERKAQMVSNLMVVLCANKDTQPIVNSGTLY